MRLDGASLLMQDAGLEVQGRGEANKGLVP